MTSEHYFQAMKFDDRVIQERIRLADSPYKAFKLGRSRAYPIKKDWDQIKDGVMREALSAKFGQNEDIKDQLLLTGDSHLVENSPRDSYWGIGKAGTGKNMLGKLLVEQREILIKK